jgi:mono/diheme cytochrome c family protein
MKKSAMRGLVAAALLVGVTGSAQLAREYAQLAVKPPAAVPPADRDQEFQPAALPALPAGMTIDDITKGDDLFHGRGGCFACHGAEAEGLPAAGSGLTRGLNFIPIEWQPIDSLIQAGITEVDTRSPIRMPAKGARGDLTPSDSKLIAAYVWAIAKTRGEPWQGGHPSHSAQNPPGASDGTAGLAQVRKPPA